MKSLSSNAALQDSGTRPWKHRTKVSLSAAAIGLSIGLIAILSPYLYLALFANIYFSAALLSIVVVQMWVRDTWKDCAYVLAASAVVIVYQRAVFQLAPHWIQTISITGFCSFVTLALRAIWGKGTKRDALGAGFAGAVLLLLLYFFSGPLLLRTTRTHPHVLDLYLYSFDASLHIQPSFILGALLRKWSALNRIGQVFYVGLPVSLTVAFAGLIASQVKRGIEAILSFCLGGPLAIFCYGVFPAIGPRALFQGSFPFHPMSTSQASRLLVEPLTIHSLVNAMPSLHMTWALLAWWYSRGLSWMAQSITALFLIFTVITTMGMGEHYFVDLLVAFPFALFLESVCSISLPLASKERILGVSVGGFGTAGWFLLLRFENELFWRSPVVPWTLVAITIVLILLCHARLQAGLNRYLIGSTGYAASGSLLDHQEASSEMVTSELVSGAEHKMSISYAGRESGVSDAPGRKPQTTVSD